MRPRRLGFACAAALLWNMSVAAQSRTVPESFTQVVRRISPAVVSVSALRLHRPHLDLNRYPDPNIRLLLERRIRKQPERTVTLRSHGSGIIVDARGYVLTNAHGVFQADEIRVRTWDGQEYPAAVAGTDPATDLAVLRLQGRRTWPAARLGDSDRVQPGDWVLAAGSPLGLEQSVTFGIVSAKSRVLGADVYIQTDAALNPGSSGGPLVDLEGRVIGINSAVLDKSGVFAGIGFAVPSNIAAKVLNDSIAAGAAHRGGAAR